MISRDTLLDAFADRRFEPFDRSVDVLDGEAADKRSSPIPKQPRLIVTVPGEGYRFDGLRSSSPQTAKLPDLDPAAKRVGPGPPTPLRRRPAVRQPRRRPGARVLRRRRDRQPDDRPITDSTAPSSSARGTAFAYKGKIVDAKQIGRELNVRYVLEGSVQRGGKTHARQWLGQELVLRRGGPRRALVEPGLDGSLTFSGLRIFYKGATAEYPRQGAISLRPGCRARPGAMSTRWSGAHGSDVGFVGRIGCRRTAAEPVALRRGRPRARHSN